MKAKTILLPAILLMAALFVSGCYKWEPVNGIRGTGPMFQQARNVSHFTGLQVDVDAKVNIIQGRYAELTVRGQQNILDVLETRVINGVLLIQYTTQVWRHEKLEIDIVVPELELISSFGSSDIRYLSPLIIDDLSLDIFGSGSITIRELDAKSVRSRISGSGNVNIMGLALTQQVNISGSGNYNAGELQSDIALINIFGSGNCRILVNQSLNAAINGSGSVYYSGNPPIFQTSIFGSGKVIQVQ